MSSDTDEESCYGNIAQRLQSLKSKFLPPTSSVVVGNTLKNEKSSERIKNKEKSSTIAVEDFNSTINSTDNEELTLDAIIANNSKGKKGRKRKSGDDDDIASSSRRGRRKGRAKKDTASTALDSVKIPSIPPDDDTPLPSKRSRRGRSAGLTENSSSRGTTPRGRQGRGRNRGRRGNSRSGHASRQTTTNYPTYSIGCTDDYPDLCDEQELFSAKKNELEIIEDNDMLDNDNEELSVKVYWQNYSVVRFNIRKYQKIDTIYKYFSQKENVGNDKLLFMYNDKILKADDTPDSIDYNIAKFIDGGIVNKDISNLVQQGIVESNGLKLKFQCQMLKKPFEVSISPENKLGLAMTKFAEHIDTPLDKLRFYFDGDILSSKSTPQDYELEGGECIDVKIIS